MGGRGRAGAVRSGGAEVERGCPPVIYLSMWGRNPKWQCWDNAIRLFIAGVEMAHRCGCTSCESIKRYFLGEGSRFRQQLDSECQHGSCACLLA